MSGMTRDIKHMTLSEMQGGLCFYCGKVLGDDKTVDHFIPKLYGGVTAIENSVVACHPCNNEKGCRMPTADEAARLFLSRKDQKYFPVSERIKKIAMPALARQKALLQIEDARKQVIENSDQAITRLKMRKELGL